MTRLESVYESLYQAGVDVDYDNLNGHKAVSLKLQSHYFICVDKKNIINERDEFSALIHEEGHFESGTTHHVFSPYQLVRKHEYCANKRAVLKHIDINELISVLQSGMVYIWQLAEHFDVTEDFMEIAIKIYRRMGYFD